MASALLLALGLAAAPVAPLAPAVPVAEPPRAPGSTAASTPVRAAPADVDRPTPRSLSTAALADELRDASRRRRDELAAIQAERAKLAQMKQDIEAARAALREETARLEKRVQEAEKGPLGAGKPGPRTPEPEPGKGPVDQLARTVKGMKPDQAASVVARLEKPLAVQLLRRMRPGDAAAVLDRMKPEAAAEMIGLLAAAGGTR